MMSLLSIVKTFQCVKHYTTDGDHLLNAVIKGPCFTRSQRYIFTNRSIHGASDKQHSINGHLASVCHLSPASQIYVVDINALKGRL